MKKSPRLPLLFAAAFGLLCPVTLSAITPDEIHNELRQLKATYETAVNSGNFAPLETLFDANSSGVTVDNQTFRTFAELKAIYDKFHASFPGVVYRIELNANPSLLSGDLALSTGTASEYVKTAAGEFNYTSSFTAVLRRTDTGWKLVRSQVTMDPFRNSVVTFFEHKAKLTYGLLGLGVGALLGLLIGRCTKRCKCAAPAATTG